MDNIHEPNGVTFQSQYGDAGAAHVDHATPVIAAPAAAPAAGEPQPAAEAGSVEKIRDILFGVQMRDYDQRFAGLEERLSRDVNALREETNRRFDALQAFMRQELDALNHRLSDEHNGRQESVNTLGANLGNQLSQQGQHLTEEIVRRFEELSASLERQAKSLRHDKADRSTVASLLNEMAQRLASHSDHGE
jgi:exonuclease VII large subunit